MGSPMLSVCPICGSLLLLSFQDISSAIVKTWYTQKGGRTTTVLQPWILVSPQATHHPNFGTGAQLDQAVFPLVPSAVCRASILDCLPPPGTSPAVPGWSPVGAMLANWLQMCSTVRKWHRALAPPAWGRATRRLACHCTAAASIARRLTAAALALRQNRDYTPYDAVLGAIETTKALGGSYCANVSCRAAPGILDRDGT